MSTIRLLPLFALLPAVIFSRGLAEEPASQTFDANGVKIHYTVEGKGEPVVLIHGLNASANLNWRLPGIIQELAKDHQVIALDLPGHGRSDKPEKEEAYGTQIVEDIILLMDHLKVKQAHIVGYSLGGMVAVKLLATHPDRALSGTLGGMGWLKEGSRLQRFWEQVPAREGRTPPAFLHGIGKLAVSEEDLKKIRVPVKIFVGDNDPVKRLYVAPLRDVRQDWEVVEIKDAGHINCIAKKEFREGIAQWLRKNTKP